MSAGAFELELAARLESVRELSELLEQMMAKRYPGNRRASELALAVVEAFTNIVRHNRPSAPVSIRIDALPGEISVTLRDDGHAFDMTALPAVLPADPLAETGRGRYLIGAFCEHFEYRREGDNNLHVLARKLD